MIEGAEADLIVLPELWATGFFAEQRHAPDAEDRAAILALLADLARKHERWIAGGSQVERTPGGELHNTAVLFAPDGTQRGLYRKIHLYGHGAGESRNYASGHELACVAVGDLHAGLAICYDLRFPELYRALVSAGATVLITMAAWPVARAAVWRALHIARAIENQCYVVACNGSGEDGGTVLAGGSLIIAPDGRVLAEAGHAPAVLEAEVAAEVVELTRAAFPVLDDRRADVFPSCAHGVTLSSGPRP